MQPNLARSINKQGFLSKVHAAVKIMVATVLGENKPSTFKYLFQTISSDVLPHDVRVFNLSGII